MKLLSILFFFVMSMAHGQQTINTLTTKDLTVNGKVRVNSTTQASRPCPSMTQTQRDAIATPASGDCIYNSTTNTLNAYNGSTWGSIGGGLSAWVTAYIYQAGDVVIESNKIYKALSSHTSGTFATDLAGGKWVELSTGVTDHTQLSNIGTNTHAQIDAHIANTSNPHAVTKAQVGLSNVSNVDTSTTANITDSTNKRFVTDANLTTIGNQSGVNTGDLLTKSLVDGSAVTTTQLNYPNAQATTTGTNTRRVETGSTNLLANPSFETATASTGHTLTNATAADDTTHKTDGLKGIAVTPTSNGGGIKQISTTNAASLAGSQGMVNASIYTLGTDVHVCPLMNNARPTDTIRYCALVPKTTTLVPMPEVIVPFTMDGTSNGYEIYSDTTTAFTVDEVKVGKSAPFQAVSGAQLLGTVTVTGCAGRWTSTTTSMSDYTAQTGCIYTTTGQAQAPSTMIPAVKFASLPAGDYKIEYTGGGYNTTANTATFERFYDGTSYAKELISSNVGPTTAAPMFNYIDGTFSYSTTQSNIQFNLRTQPSAGTSTLSGMTAEPAVIKVWYFPPASRIYSTANSSVTALYAGTPSGTLTSSFNTMSLSTKVADSASAYSSGSYTVPSTGNYDISASADVSGTYATNIKLELAIFIDGVQSYTNVNKTAGAVNELVTPISVRAIPLSAGQVVTIRVSTNTTSPAWVAGAGTNFFSISKVDSTITGSFAGIEKCANDYECTDTFSANVAADGTVTNENVDWISGNCTNAVPRVCTFLTNTLKDGASGLSVAPQCWADLNNGAASNIRYSISAVSTSSVSAADIVANTGATATAQPFTLYCKKAGQDFKPKTAKTASSIGVPTVPGILTSGTGNAIDTFKVKYGATATTVCASDPCPYISQIGTAGNRVNWSAGSYTLVTNKTYSKLTCTLQPQNPAQLVGIDNSSMECSNCNSINALVYTTGGGVAANSYGTWDCIGSY